MEKGQTHRNIITNAIFLITIVQVISFFGTAGETFNWIVLVWQGNRIPAVFRLLLLSVGLYLYGKINGVNSANRAFEPSNLTIHSPKVRKISISLFFLFWLLEISVVALAFHELAESWL